MGEKGLVLSIAGFDPTGGAGVLLDVKVFSLFGLKAGGIPATLTLQNTSLFQGWEPIEGEYLEKALKLVFSDLPVSGIKIGMIGTSENAEIIGNFLKREREKISWVVLDPVLKASLNYNLFSSSEFIKTLKTKVFPYVDVITPNIYEAEILSEKKAKKREDLLKIAKSLLNLGTKAVIITGWESSSFIWDFFYSPDNGFFLKKKKLTGYFHGTGCAFSSALLAYLVQGFKIEEAFKKAKNWVYFKLKKAEKEKIGGKLWLFL